MTLCPERFRPDGSHDLGDSLTISRWQHQNGLTAILCPDVGSPLCAVQIWYRVGSADDPLGKTGIAHLFEHLMFNRTQNFATGDFDRLIEEVGGDCNAATWVDWTSYSITVPAAECELALTLEADRMTHLILDAKVLEAEREVVLNERLERVEDDIGGSIDEQLAAMAFSTHPYGRPTIGFEADIRALNLTEIRQFYQRFYRPPNAIVVVVGNIDPNATLKLIDRLFGATLLGAAQLGAAQLGAAQPSEMILGQRPTEPNQTSPRVGHIHHDSDASRLVCAYKIPDQQDPDWPALAALAGLLSGGPSARLSRHLVIERELAIYADCDTMPFREPGLFRISAGGTVGTSIKALDEAISEVVDSIATQPISAQEMEKVRSATETDFWLELETAEGKAEALGHYQATHGDFSTLFRTAEALANVTAADLTRVASTYLTNRTKTTISCGRTPLESE